MIEIENQILTCIRSVLFDDLNKLIVIKKYKIKKELDKAADDIINDYQTTEDFPYGMGSRLATRLSLDSYFKLPYRLRVMTGLQQLGVTLGDDLVDCVPNSFKYGGYLNGELDNG